MLRLDFPTANLRPATYNPRRIADDALEMLKRSITAIGFCKPIIVTKDSLIIAGHQRTKAARALGIKAVPAWVLKSCTVQDEVVFNQLHNGTDLDDIDSPVFVPPGTESGFFDVAPEQIKGDLRSTGAPVRTEIGMLVMRHGPWGCAVATHSGRVVSSPQYALACKLNMIPCRVYRVSDAKGDEAAGWFKRQYGQFSYEHLPRTTYVQAFAQLPRLREAKDGREAGEGVSVLYEKVVLPKLSQKERLLDFACGRGDYVRMLRRMGYRAQGVEFFHCKTQGIIDTKMVHRFIADTCADLETNGLFDVVVLDSVLNSVDSQQAEADVLNCVSAFCKPGGRVYFSWRARESQDRANSGTAAASNSHHRKVEFLDDHGLTGRFRNGLWFYQKFHTDEQARQLGLKHFGTPCRVIGTATDACKQIATVKAHDLPDAEVEASIRREFNLPWPGGLTVNRADEAVAAWRAARDITAARGG